MKNQEMQFANLSMTEVMFALLGKPPFEKAPYKFIRLVSNGHKNYEGIYAKKGSGIKSVRDLKGRRCYMELKGHIWHKQRDFSMRNLKEKSSAWLP